MKEELSDKTIIHTKHVEEEGVTSVDVKKFSMRTMYFTRRSLSKGVSISQKAHLEIFWPGKQSASGYDLGISQIFIGRKPVCDICLPFHGVSRVHSRIFYRDEEYYIEDLGSTNGTFINTINIVRCILRNNDQISIGEVRMLFAEEKLRE